MEQSEIDISRRAGKALTFLTYNWFMNLSREQTHANIDEFKKETQKAKSFDVLPIKIQKWILDIEKEEME